MERSSSIKGLERVFEHVAGLVSKPVGSPHELEALLRQVYHTLHDVDFRDFPVGELGQLAPEYIHALFTMRMVLRSRIDEWNKAGFLKRPAQNALRDAVRILRYGVDVLGEIAIKNEQLGSGEAPRRAFTGTNYNTQVNPKYFTAKNIPFRSGDVLLVRGSAHNSAAIARIGDVDTQFSHVGLVYVDSAGQHWVVEALIEDGSVVNTLEHMLGHGVGRAVLYRHTDAEVAARAAELAHQRVRASQAEGGRHIPYDYSMRLVGRSKLFCSKLVHQAYADATKGSLNIPAFKTRFDSRNLPFYRMIGVKAVETFAPGDIDLDPRFDLVAEWQDYRATAYLRRQDMVMTKFFEWMETKGYRFRSDVSIWLIALFGHLSSFLSDDARKMISSSLPKVPRSMRRRTIAAVAMLHKSAEVAMPVLAEVERKHIAETGKPPHARHLLAELEKFREISGGKIGYLRGKV